MIPIQNVYYMLSYAFKMLDEQGYKNLATEQFNNVAELCAAILIKGTSIQIKRGLGREYIEQTETLSSLRGKIEISESVKHMTMQDKKMICSFDEFSVNSKMNQIIKSTMLLLIRSSIDKSLKKGLKKVLVFFSDVDEIDVHTINWTIHYNKNNQTYRMLISICYLVIKGLLQTTQDGSTRLMDFVNEKYMCHLYEKFILGYYIKEHTEIKVSHPKIPWALDDDFDDLLPDMQTDITLSNTNNDNVLIIDAKYYSHTMQSQYNSHSVISGNLYQIFAYVKNKEAQYGDEPHKVSGILLYAKTDEDIVPDNTYQMSGNEISVRTLDLNCDFKTIKSQLDLIVEEYF